MRKHTRIDRIGEIHQTTRSGKLKIIEYFSAKNCTVEFESGKVVKNIPYHRIKKRKSER